jgi:hypothetical protein
LAISRFSQVLFDTTYKKDYLIIALRLVSALLSCMDVEAFSARGRFPGLSRLKLLDRSEQNLVKVMAISTFGEGTTFLLLLQGFRLSNMVKLQRLLFFLFLFS